MLPSPKGQLFFHTKNLQIFGKKKEEEKSKYLVKNQNQKKTLKIKIKTVGTKVHGRSDEDKQTFYLFLALESDLFFKKQIELWQCKLQVYTDIFKMSGTDFKEIVTTWYCSESISTVTY